MALEDARYLRCQCRAPTDLGDPRPCVRYRLGVVNDWCRVVAPDPTAERLLLPLWQEPGGVDEAVGNPGEHRNPAANKGPPWILILPLLDGVVETKGRVTRRPRLHLDLWVVNSGLVVEEEAGQVVGRLLPVEPEAR